MTKPLSGPILRTTISITEDDSASLLQIDYNRSEAVRTLISRYFTLLELSPQAALSALAVLSTSHKLNLALAEREARENVGGIECD